MDPGAELRKSYDAVAIGEKKIYGIKKRSCTLVIDVLGTVDKEGNTRFRSPTEYKTAGNDQNVPTLLTQYQEILNQDTSD